MSFAAQQGLSPRQDPAPAEPAPQRASTSGGSSSLLSLDTAAAAATAATAEAEAALRGFPDRQVSERRGGWYQRGGNDSSDLSDMEPQLLSHHPSLRAQQQHAHAANGASPWAALNGGSGDAAKPARIATARGSVAPAPAAATAGQAEEGSPLRTSARRVPGASSSSAFSAHALNGGGGAPSPPHSAIRLLANHHQQALSRSASASPMRGSDLHPSSSLAGGQHLQLQGSFRVLEPTTHPGGHLADSTAVLAAAMGHAVPAALLDGEAGGRRSAHSVSVLQREPHLQLGRAGSGGLAAAAAGSPAAGPSSPLAHAGGRQRAAGRLSLELAPSPQQQLLHRQAPAGEAAASEEDGGRGIGAGSVGVVALVAPPTPGALDVAGKQHAATAAAEEEELGAGKAGVAGEGREAQGEVGAPSCALCSDGAAKTTALTLHWLSPPRTALVVCKLSHAVYPLLNMVLRFLRCLHAACSGQGALLGGGVLGLSLGMAWAGVGVGGG